MYYSVLVDFVLSMVKHLFEEEGGEEEEEEEEEARGCHLYTNACCHH